VSWNQYMAPKWTMEALLAEQQRICSTPDNWETNPHRCGKYCPKAQRKLDLIAFAIANLIAQKHGGWRNVGG